MRTKTKNPASTACRVIISVSGGVADVIFKPRGVEVCILDYAVDYADHDPDHPDHHPDRDPDGQACFIQQLAADDKVISHEDWPMVQDAARRINGHAKRRWQCPQCRRTVHSSDQSLAEAGTPYCPDCDLDMQMM
jgi:hypothetical protein